MRTQSTTRSHPAGEATPATPGAALKGASRASSPVHMSSRLYSWKITLFQSLGRELNALHRQQQERAFMATSHGLNYRDGTVRISSLH